MANWFQRLLLGPQRPAAPPPSLSRLDGLDAPGSEHEQLRFFEWMVGAGAVLEAPLNETERRLLAALDGALACEETRAVLVPYAPGVIRQLLRARHDKTPSAPTSLDAARIARGALKPLFMPRGEPLWDRCALRVWQHAEAKADACREEAASRGLDPFEGYLVGLLHSIGWTAALRAIDRSDDGAPAQFTRAFALAFDMRREAFFMRLMMPWQLGDPLSELAMELLDGGLAAAHSPLGEALRAADQRATMEMLGAQSWFGAFEAGSRH